jgi:hypothetical protein
MFRKPDPLAIVHWIAFMYGALLTLYYLFYCYLSFSGAMQDVRKYGSLGASHPLRYYLEVNNFKINVGFFLCASAEFLLYITQYHRTEEKGRFWKSVLYFSVISALHTGLWFHANSLALPAKPPFEPIYFTAVRYRHFANLTVLPSFMYSVAYCLHMWKLRSKRNG